MAGKPISYDASSLAGEVVEVSGRRAKCKLCGRSVRTSMLKHHLQSKHCNELLELLEKHKIRRLIARHGLNKLAFTIEFYCTGCGWRRKITVESNTGPPNVRKLLNRMGLTKCPDCGKPFAVRGFEFRWGRGEVVAD